MKYHKSINIPYTVKNKIIDLIRMNQAYKITFSNHALASLQDEKDIEDIKMTISNYCPQYSHVFEAVEYGQIEKIGFRIPFNSRDIVFILSSNWKILTIWTNDKNDTHSTLKTLEYAH